jgi:NADPH:quinone reductase-like Zn-dependent oxidoreductase
MRAIEVDKAGKLARSEAEPPLARQGEVFVRVRAVSINRGEILRARVAAEGFRPGWDFAGDVMANHGSSHLVPGTRVAGFLPAGAWADVLAVAPRQIAPIPDGVSYEVAAALPVAGLTALGAIDAGASLVGRKVLVTGATGGVGMFAAHLAALSGAQVTVVVRRPVEECRALFPQGTRVISAQGGLDGVSAHGPFDHIVETLGGATLAEAMTMLTHAGKCVTLGVTDQADTTFDAERFFMTGSASLQGFVLFRDRLSTPAEGMERLLRLVASGQLPVEIGLIESWENIEAVADKLIARQFVGKAVLTL